MKSHKFGSRSASVLASVMAVSGTAMVEEAQAAIIINIQQVGADVIATYSGSWDTTGGELFGLGSATNGISGGEAGLEFANSFSGSNLPFNDDVWTNSFNLTGTIGGWGSGAGAIQYASLSSSNLNLLKLYSYGDGEGFILINADYVSNSAISGSMTFSNSTMVSLGIDNYGTFVYSSEHDSITVNLIETPSAIPGAGLASMASVGLAGLARRRRR